MYFHINELNSKTNIACFSWNKKRSVFFFCNSLRPKALSTTILKLRDHITIRNNSKLR